MNLITIAGQDYPVKYGRMALAKVMKLAGAKGLKDFDKIDEIPPEKWGEFILAGIHNGNKVNGSETLPDPVVLENLLDEDVEVFMQCLGYLGEDISPKEKTDTEGN